MKNILLFISSIGALGLTPTANATGCPWYGQTVAHGSWVQGFKSFSVPYGSSCEAAVFQCVNGSYSPQATFLSHQAYTCGMRNAGLAFNLATAENGTHVVRVGDLDLKPDGTYTGRLLYSSQSGSQTMSSGLSGINGSGSYCGQPIRKPVFLYKSISGYQTVTHDKVYLTLDGHLVTFARVQGSKNLELESVDGVAARVGYGFLSLNGSVNIQAVVQPGFGGRTFRASAYWHKRGSEAWWNIGTLGLYPLKHTAGNVAGETYVNSSGTPFYDSYIFNSEALNYGIVYRHFGHDFARVGCNNSDGHTVLLYGFGENNSLEGFMLVETSPDHRGAYLSVARMLRD